MIKEDLERINKRGPADLEEQIEMLTKQVEFMKSKCRQAGEAILDQEVQIASLTKEIDRISEENDNLRTMMGNNNDKPK
jgi:chromosome segregation ATPase